jgi:hypothetical protein
MSEREGGNKMKRALGATASLVAISLLSGCAYLEREHYYSVESQKDMKERGSSPSYRSFEGYSNSKDAFLSIWTKNHGSFAVYDLLLGPLTIPLSYWGGGTSLPTDSFELILSIMGPCGQVETFPLKYMEGEYEECVSTRIRVKPEQVLLRLLDGTVITPASFETETGSVMKSENDRWGKGLEAYYLSLDYTLPAIETKSMELVIDGISLDGRKQSFPHLQITESARWNLRGVLLGESLDDL